MTDKATTMADVVSAAQEWVESIRSWPGMWAGDEERALIRAVRVHVPGVLCRWTEDPEYVGWGPDRTDPAWVPGPEDLS